MVVTRKVALKLNDPASSVDILPDALEEQLKVAYPVSPLYITD